jgi:hypothetical protein
MPAWPQDWKVRKALVIYIPQFRFEEAQVSIDGWLKE